MARSGRLEAIRPVLEPVLAARGFDLEEVTIAPAGRRQLLRVVVDRDGGVDIDAVAAVSRELSAALDAADALPGAPYVLEVSSPGVDRPLSQPRHWRRAVGRLVQVPLREGGSVAGRVAAADDAGVTLASGAQSRRFDYAALGRGRVQVEFAAGEQP